MSIPLELLKLTESRAPAFCIYGGPGLKKTLAIHTLPYPIEMHDFEGGTAPLLPWVRRKRKWNESTWLTLAEEDRQKAWSLVPEGLRSAAVVKPLPLIDIISYDIFEPESYTHFIGKIGSFNSERYNSIALDSLQEFAFDVQTFSKNAKGIGVYDSPEAGTMPWTGIQERTAIAFRRLKSLRDLGVCVYLIGSEAIDKDYVNDPRSKEKGALKEEAYSVKGTVNLPGKMTGLLPHLVDIMAHAKQLNGQATFVTQSEPLPGGAASWDAKDRYGRLEKYMEPNIRKFFDLLYGKDIRTQIYSKGAKASA